MYILLIGLLITGFFFLSIAFERKINLHYPLREAFIISLLFFFLWIYLSTELLGLFNGVALPTLCGAYTLSIAILTAFIFKEKSSLTGFINQLRAFKALAKSDVLLLIAIVFILAVAGFTALYSAPNNWDSMTYHLGRMMHWIQNGNVGHYPTHISRQLFNPPLAEYTLMHFYLLANGDQWVNAVQFISFAACILTASLIVKAVGYNFRIQLFASLIMATLPMAILQASNTKNELTVAFLVMATVYFIIQYKNSGRAFYLWLTGVATGLALLTKSTSYIYLLPVCAVYWFPYPFHTIKGKVKDGVLVLLVALVLASPFYIRNYSTYGHALGATAGERSWYTNQEFTWQTLVSNVSRNVYIHLSNTLLFDDEALFARQGNFFQKCLFKLHEKLKINIVNPKTTWGNNLDFTLARDEDYAGNFLHILLIMAGFCSVPFFLPRLVKNIPLFSYGLVLGFGFVFFCLYLKWQPWHSRLHVPYFALACPLIAIFLSKLNVVLRSFLLMLLFAGSITYLLENSTRTLLFKKPRIYTLTRDEVMFWKKGPEALDDYQKVTAFVAKNSPQNVGLIINGDGWDYPFFHMIKQVNPDIKIYHVEVSENATPYALLKKFPVISPEIVISTESRHSDTINVAGKKYSNVKKLHTMDVYVRQ